MFRFLLLTALLNFAVAGNINRLPSIAGLSRIPDGRIVGGIETTIEHFPHQVSLRYFSSHRCGGAILKEDIVITAAHCVDGIPLINMAFVAGTSDISQDGETRKLKKSMVHEKYNDYRLEFDVAVVQLQSGFGFSEKIQPITLAGSNEDLRAGTEVLVSGWGTLEENGPEPKILRYVSVGIISDSDCVEYYKEIRSVTESMICAGVTNGGKDACQGDSGGPMIEGSRLYGIVSWGKGCARAEYPGVYTKVSAVRDWVDAKLASL